jgi:hypothetical protein
MVDDSSPLPAANGSRARQQVASGAAGNVIVLVRAGDPGGRGAPSPLAAPGRAVPAGDAIKPAGTAGDGEVIVLMTAIENVKTWISLGRAVQRAIHRTNT